MADRDFQEPHLYKGTIKPEQVSGSSEFDQMPGKTNPYRYYQLSPDYYDFSMNRKKLTPSIHITSPGHANSHDLKPRNFTKTGQGKQQYNTLPKPVITSPDKTTKSNKNCCWSSRKKINPEKNHSSDMQVRHQQSPRLDTLVRANDGTWLKTPTKVNKNTKGDNATTQSYTYSRTASRVGGEKELTFPNTLSNRPQNKKSKQTELNLSGPTKTYPVAKETLQQNPAKDLTQVISPGTIAFNPLYKETDSLYSPLVPVALEDYASSVPVKRVSSKTLVAGNPLIPVMVPAAENAGSNDFYSSRDSPVYSDVDMGRDYEYEYDSFSRRFTAIPSYKAVGSMLNDSD